MPQAVSGFNLLEALIVLLVLSLVSTLSVPPLLEASSRLRLLMAARELASVLRLAKFYAIRHSAHVAVRFQAGPAGGVSFALYRDSDGDGVRTSDIDAGVDPRVTPDRRLAYLGGSVRFGFPAGPVPLDHSSWKKRPTEWTF